MSSQITGIVKHITQAAPVKDGSSVIKQAIGIELSTQSQYPELAVVEFVGKSYEKLKDKLAQLKIGQNVEVGYNHSGREWNGRLFTSNSGWKLFIKDGYQQQMPPQEGEAPPF